MRSLDITKANLDNQINAVQEERRLGVDNQPYGRTFEVRDELAFDNFAYKHSVIGSMADLSAATVDDVVVVLQDLLRSEQRRPQHRRRRRYEGRRSRRCASTSSRFPRSRRRPPVDITEPAQKEERRTTHRGCAGPAAAARHGLQDSAELVARRRRARACSATVLSSGRSSRFYENIVRQKQLAPNVSAFGGESRGPDLFSVVGTVNPGKTRRGARGGDRCRDRAREGRTDRGLGNARRRATTRATSS